jgi:hypothetical protein
MRGATLLLTIVSGCTFITGVDQLERVADDPAPAEDPGGDDDASDDASAKSVKDARAPRDVGAAEATALSTDAGHDAAPVTEGFVLGQDCNGGWCRGGYGGTKDPANIVTASKQCTDRGYARATDFDIGGEPGGRFCAYNGTAYDCDPSCEGCDVMALIKCIKP